LDSHLWICALGYKSERLGERWLSLMTDRLGEGSAQKQGSE
jgi:hypothetical protein